MEGFLLIDKPSGMTSHDVIDRVRRITDVKRVGHAGTLDPFATGLLLVGVGRGATREMQNLVGLGKTYEATFVFGASSDTDDLTGVITSKEQIPLTKDGVQNAIADLIGDIEQIPPAYSAIKIGGKKMYEAARAGKPLKAEPRQVRIDRFDLLYFHEKSLQAEVLIECSSGTYIRSLARDLGQKLGTGGYVEKLRRTRIGSFFVANAKPLSDLNEKNWQNCLLTVQEILNQISSEKDSK